jgi:hypothetical protein
LIDETVVLVGDTKVLEEDKEGDEPKFVFMELVLFGGGGGGFLFLFRVA